MNDNMKSFIKEVGANEELKAKIEALEGADDKVAQVIAIAAEHGYTLAEEDFAALAGEDSQETGSTALSLDDLDAAAGGQALWCSIGQLAVGQVGAIVD